jgi:homopolymeric O-antigen transport system ATP-binding protein
MGAPVINVDGLGKRYAIAGRRPDTLRDSIVGAAGRAARMITGRAAPNRAGEEFWALRDVSFAVDRGEVVGIVGRNGAGKSTLLKILSRITEPTVGRVRIRGRVASLLEVGTGFHPELTGRDNVYLNGAILGMSRAEIRRKFDEIVAFAGVERFLDMAVKHYSSGMYVRLAFAVAAHLEPEILIVDEVLAVGDAAFQKKCLGKMQDVARTEGRTVLFVSHNLPSVRQLCGRAVLLSQGRIQAAGATAKVLEIYQHGLTGAVPTSVPAPSPELTEQIYATAVRLETVEGAPTLSIPIGLPWRARVAFRVVASQERLTVAVGLKSADGTAIQTAWVPPCDLEPGDYEAEFVQDRVSIEAGTYTVIVGLDAGGRGLQQFEAARLDIISENAVGYHPGISGVGIVLNSMSTSLRKL